MENDTTTTKEAEHLPHSSGLLGSVLPGSVTFESSILAPLLNNYLYEESKEYFTYNSAQLIQNAALQQRYSAFRAEKLQQGYAEEELEESFGFLLLDDHGSIKSMANRLADPGLIVGQGTCTTLGDCSKGVYISKYSDCLDLKRWYDGKTGYIVLLKLTKGRVKEVAENYTQNFTPPTAGFDCHVSEQLQAVSATTSSFLAFERTQYYMYELVDGAEKVEPCPRHVCPFAIVAFSYGKTSVPLELKEKSQEKSAFHYQPWCGQLGIKSVLYNIGLKSVHGAMFPAKLPKTVQVDHAVGVSELRKTLPQAVFEASPIGEVSFDSIWLSLYDVTSFEAGNDLAFLTQELKEKDLALVVRLEDSGFLVLLHPSNFLSYEGAGTDKAFALQAMFIYPDSRTVPRETKSGYHITKVSLEVLQVLPALNYAELEMEKCSPKQNGEPLVLLEKHLQNFAALICPGFSSSPSREASMFPDQYDVPNGFPLIAPKWTEQTGCRLRTYLKSPFSFQIPVSRALELLAAGKQQRSDDHDDDVYYYISSPEAPQTPAYMHLERDLPNETDHLSCRDDSDDVKKTAAAEHCALIEEINRPGAALVATPDNNPAERTDTSPASGDLPTEHYLQTIHAVTAQDSKQTSESLSADKCSADEFSRAFLTETLQTTSLALSSSDIGDAASTLASNAEMEVDHSDKLDCVSSTSTLASNAEMEVDHSDKADCVSDVLPVVGGQTTLAEKLQEADLPTSISPPTTSVNRTEALIKGCKDVQPKETEHLPCRDVSEPNEQPNETDLLPSSSVPGKMSSVPNRRGKRRRRKALKHKTNIVGQLANPFQNTTLPSCPSAGATSELHSSSDAIHLSPRALKKDWRSLPRRKRDWNADVSIKRSLRSDFKNTDMPCAKNDETEKDATVTELTITKNKPGPAKRKMEGINMRERYGLKTIVTDCGFVFVPHGSEVAPGDIRSHEHQQAQESSSVTTSSPVGEQPTHDKPQLSEMENSGQRMLQRHISTNTALLSEDVTEKNSEQSPVLESTEKNKNAAKDHVYKAISISKLKTVLKRARGTKSPGAQDHGKSISDTAEPKLKRGKPCNIELSDHSKQASTGSQELVENTPPKPALKTASSQEKRSSKTPEEVGCNNFGNLSPKEIIRQADQQLTSNPVEDGVEEKRISSEGQCKKDELAVGVPAPSDALNLLADLALSVNGDKLLPNLREKHLGAKTTSSPQTVIHLLRDLTPRLKLPAKSPFPEGLVVTGDLILEISKEHSYSQPTSPLAGICPQVQPLVGCVQSTKSNLLLKLPDLTNYPDFHNKGGKNGWKFLLSLSGSPAVVKTKVWSPLLLSCRSIVEKGGSIQVTRRWKENYDFKFDSKFTNDRLDKCVTRALHGKWDFSIEDSHEQVHLIFHMWIGLFYSKPTSRFFHFDQMCPSEEGKNPEKALHCVVQNSKPLPNVELTLKEDKPTSLDPVSDAIDLTVKVPGTEDYCTTETNPAPTPETKSNVEHMLDDKKPANRPSLAYSPSVPAGGLPMDYRSTVEAIDENSASDYNDCSDTDGDATKVDESTYTQVLESNSAYGQLCGLASNIKIDEQKLLNENNKEPVCKDLSTTVTTNPSNAGKMDTKSKDTAVFHQVVGSTEPGLSKVHCLLPRKKIILKSLSFIDAHKDEAPVIVHSKTASKEEKCKAQVNEENHESTPACVNSGNTNESALKIKTGSRSVISVPVSDNNDARIEVIHDENISAETKSVSAEKSINDIGDASADTSNQAKQEVESVIDGTPENVQNYDVEMRITDDATEKVRPVPDVRDEIPIDKPDANHETNEDMRPLSRALSENPGEELINDEKKDQETSAPVRDDASNIVPDVITSDQLVKPVRDNTNFHEAKNDTHEGIPVESSPHGKCDDDDDDDGGGGGATKDELCVINGILVDVQTINSPSKEASSELNVRADMLANVQDVNNLSKKATPGLDVRDETPANMQDVNEGTKDKNATDYQPDVRDFSSVDVGMAEEMFAMEEHVSGDAESDEDVTNESEIKLEAEPVCDADTESHTEDQNETVDESQDWTGCKDCNVSDQESGKVYEVNLSGDETPPKVLKEDTRELQEGEIKAEAHGESSCEVHTEAAQPEISEHSSAGHTNSTSHQVIMLKEGHSSAAVGGSCDPTQNEGESTMLPDASVVQHETPELNRYKPTEMFDVVALTEIVKPAPCEIRGSSVQGTSEEADELETLEKSTDQKPLVSTISESSPVKSVEMHEHVDGVDLSSLARRIGSEAEMNSRCCTPTLDEPAYSQGTDEVSNIQEEMLQDFTESECVKRSPTNAWLAIDSSEDSRSESDTCPAQKEQTLQDSSRSHYEYNATMKETEGSQTFITDDHVPEEDAVYPDYDAIPPRRNTTEIGLQQDRFGSYSEQYEDDFYEEPPSSLVHGARFKTEQENEWYPPDEDAYYTKSISLHQEVAYSPREITASNTDNPDWAQRIHYSESIPYVDESNERVLSFRHRAGLSESCEEFGRQGAEPVLYSKKKHKRKIHQYECGNEDFTAAVDFSIQKTFSCSSNRSSISRTQTSSPYQRKAESKQSFDWRRYFRRAGIFESNEGNDGLFHDPPSSIITMFDKKGNRLIFESPSTQKRSSGIHDQSRSVAEQQSKSVTQSLMELEYLIFSEKMTYLLKNCKTNSRAKPQHRLNISPVENPLTIQFSRLDEQNNFSALDQTWPTFSKFKIKVDMSERKAVKKAPNYNKLLHLQSFLCERGPKATCSKLSDISKECFKSYHTMMNDICIGKTDPQQNEELKRKWDFECATTSKQCYRIKKDMFDHPHDNLNSIVRHAYKTKCKFFILVTSADPFFEETKDLLEAEGHTAVEPYQFEFDASGQMPLLVILRNEDIAQHIFEVPLLLELKKSSRVLFVGIDQPDDVVNLTHQELFAKGGFVVFDETALDTLSLENMKKFVGIVEELDKKGKWKWFLHYRDSRKLRENARDSPEAQRKKQFIGCCQEAGIVEVLPYHDCDVISRDRPDYLRCLVHLQIQNISARFPVFITDMPDDTFEKNGILTMNIYTFSRILSNDTCSVS